MNVRQIAIVVGISLATLLTMAVVAPLAFGVLFFVNTRILSAGALFQIVNFGLFLVLIWVMFRIGKYGASLAKLAARSSDMSDPSFVNSALGQRNSQPPRAMQGEIVSPPLLPPHQATDDSLRQTIAPQPSGPSGVGGWLLFFAVWLALLSPLLVFGQAAGLWERGKPMFGAFPSLRAAVLWTTAASAAVTFYGLAVGFIIWRGDKTGLKHAKRFLVVRLLGFFVTILLAYGMISDLPDRLTAAFFSGTIRDLFTEVIFFLVWWLYLWKSIRVKNTYQGEGA